MSEYNYRAPRRGFVAECATHSVCQLLRRLPHRPAKVVGKQQDIHAPSNRLTQPVGVCDDIAKTGRDERANGFVNHNGEQRSESAEGVNQIGRRQTWDAVQIECGWAKYYCPERPPREVP
jgi:hypothetical protein